MPMLAVNGPFSGFAQLVGFEVEEWADGRAAVALELDGRHVNRSGAMHGGGNILAIGEGTFRYRRGGPEDEA